MTTISVVVGNPGRTSTHEINVGLSTLERDALDGRLEINVVLDDADTKLTALERPATARRRWRAVQSQEALAARGARIHAGAGTCCGCRRTPASSADVIAVKRAVAMTASRARASVFAPLVAHRWYGRAGRRPSGACRPGARRPPRSSTVALTRERRESSPGRWCTKTPTVEPFDRWPDGRSPNPHLRA